MIVRVKVRPGRNVERARGRHKVVLGQHVEFECSRKVAAMLERNSVVEVLTPAPKAPSPATNRRVTASPGLNRLREAARRKWLIEQHRRDMEAVRLADVTDARYV